MTRQDMKSMGHNWVEIAISWSEEDNGVRSDRLTSAREELILLSICVCVCVCVCVWYSQCLVHVTRCSQKAPSSSQQTVRLWRATVALLLRSATRLRQTSTSHARRSLINISRLLTSSKPADVTVLVRASVCLSVCLPISPYRCTFCNRCIRLFDINVT